MSAHYDALDILDIEPSQTNRSAAEQLKESLLNPGAANKKVQKKGKNEVVFKKPEGMAREVYALLYSDKKDLPPLIQTDTFAYTTNRVNFNSKLRVRPWRWMPFTNPARADGAVLYHWRREEDEYKEYPFARFNKELDMPPAYTEQEYLQHLVSETWSKEETDYLVDMCRQYHRTFVVIQDRWDTAQFMPRSLEDIKERYYIICATLEKIRGGPDQDANTYVYPANHERARKKQLEIIFNRTQEEEEEIEYLQSELKKISARQRERERKKQDLQKLLSAVAAAEAAGELHSLGPGGESRQDGLQGGSGGGSARLMNLKRRSGPHGTHLTHTHHALHHLRATEQMLGESAGIKFPEIKQTTYLKSTRMKIPSSLGQKKIKVVEQLITDFNIDPNPCPTEKMCGKFNELRSEMVLLYEMKLALSGCEFELQSIKHHFETINPKKVGEVVSRFPSAAPAAGTSVTPACARIVGETGAGGPGPPSAETTASAVDTSTLPADDDGPAPNRKRKAALDQGNLLMRLKKGV